VLSTALSLDVRSITFLSLLAFVRPQSVVVSKIQATVTGERRRDYVSIYLLAGTEATRRRLHLI